MKQFGYIVRGTNEWVQAFELGNAVRHDQCYVGKPKPGYKSFGLLRPGSYEVITEWCRPQYGDIELWIDGPFGELPPSRMEMLISLPWELYRS